MSAATEAMRAVQWGTRWAAIGDHTGGPYGEWGSRCSVLMRTAFGRLVRNSYESIEEARADAETWSTRAEAVAAIRAMGYEVRA